MRLHYRIVVPFILVSLLTVSAVAAIAVSVMKTTLERRVEEQVRTAATLVAQSDFSLNATILQSVKAIAGADVVTFTTEGRVLASTVAGPRRSVLESAIVEGFRSAPGAAAERVRQRDCGSVPCYVGYEQVLTRPGVVVAVVAETRELQTVVQTVTRTVVVAAVLSALAMAFASQIVTRRVTAPLEALVAFARTVTSDSRARAQEGSDEVGRLGHAFNQMLDRLETSREALVRSEKLALAGLLTARVAHDVRNPLSSIKMQTQLLRARVERDQAAREMADAVLRDVRQVEGVVNNLLETARPGRLQLASADLNAMVADVVARLTPQLTYGKIVVETDLGTLPPVRFDAERFKQALVNLIVNAADAMPSGGTLLVRTRAAGGADAAVDVIDDGSGVAADLSDRVFDPFVSTKRGGVGLGLVNVKAMAESHGGSVALSPREPRGTQATLTLPIAGPVDG